MVNKNVAPNEHIQRFLRLPAAPRLLPLFAGCVNPSKEITESMGAQQLVYEVSRMLSIRRGDAGVALAVVGDGSTPRTGALIALTSGWRVTSVDPALAGAMPRWQKWGAAACPRLSLDARPVQEVTTLFDIAVAVHAHVSAAHLRRIVKDGGLLISLPCCVPHMCRPDTQQVEDPMIMSAQRTFFVEQL